MSSAGSSAFEDVSMMLSDVWLVLDTNPVEEDDNNAEPADGNENEGDNPDQPVGKKAKRWFLNILASEGEHHRSSH